MSFVEQSIKVPVTNIDKLVGDKDKELKSHGEILPGRIRAIFCGSSNCGKTNALIALLLHPQTVKFQNIYLYSKSANQPKYQFLKKIIDSIPGMKFFTFTDNEQVIRPDETLKYSLMIFDDIATEKQKPIMDFFSMGRHMNLDCFLLCHSYSYVSKRLIRDNANFLAVFQMNEKNLKHIYTDHVSPDMTFQKFQDLCHDCWKISFQFLVIDKS